MTKLYHLILLLCLVFLISCGDKVTHNYYPNQKIVPGEFIVKTIDKTVLANSDCKIVEKISYNLFKIKCDEEKEIDNIQGADYIEPNYIWHAIGNDDALFDKLWGLNNVNGIDISAINAWTLEKGSKNVKIMIIDTGIDYNHPDLINQIWTNEAELNGEAGVDDDKNGCIDDIHGCDFANNDGDPMDDNSHGTHCSGTIGAMHNTIGVAGVMANVTLVGCKFLTSSGSGTTANAIKCIDYGIAIGVDLMSNSWGGTGSSQALKEAIERARDANIIFTAAAGNSNSDNDINPHYPSSYQVENIISVAAHDKDGQMASFSCYGKNTVHIAAPGVGIMSTVPGGQYKAYSGTSMATPHVSGVLGLLLSYEGFSSFSEIKERMMATGVYNRSWKNLLISGSRIDAYNLLRNFRPERPAQPSPEKWIKAQLNKKIESVHPYVSNINKNWIITVKDAKFIRVVIKKMDLESGYDFLKFFDKTNNFYEKISGNKKKYVSTYIEGDTVKINFKSDSSVEKWGFIIEEIEYQK